MTTMRESSAVTTETATAAEHSERSDTENV